MNCRKLLLFCVFISGADVAQRNFPCHNPVSPKDKFFSGANKEFCNSRHLFISSVALLLLILLLLILLLLILLPEFLYESQGWQESTLGHLSC